MKISGHDHRATINDAISKSAFIERWPPPEGYGFIYLAAVVDVFSRRVLSHRISITLETGFCIEALQ